MRSLLYPSLALIDLSNDYLAPPVFRTKNGDFIRLSSPSRPLGSLRYIGAFKNHDSTGEFHSCLSISALRLLSWKNLCEASCGLILELWRAMAFYSPFFFFFFILPPSLSLLSAYTKSPSSPLCVTVNHERARGPGRPRERRRSGKRSRGRRMTRRVRRVAWEQRKATRRKMQRDGGASSRLASRLLYPPSFSTLLLFSVSVFLLSPARSFLTSGPLPRLHNLSSGFQ